MSSTSVSAGPVTQSERIVSIDVLRGFALLGILVVNMQLFAMIEAVLFNPPAYGDLTGANRLVWVVSYLLFDQKVMTIFSMLFGAGIVILTERVAARRGSPAATHYSRMMWLIVFGMLHGYLLWYGDILYSYGMCGLVVYLFRRVRPSWLIVWGIASIAVASGLFLLCGLAMHFGIWAPGQGYVADFRPGFLEIQRELDTYRSGWIGQMAYRVPSTIDCQTFVFLVWSSWRAGGLMLLGMGLYKLGVFSGRLSARTYALMLAVGLLVGLPLVGYGIHRYEEEGWNPAYVLYFGYQYNYWASLLVSLGWVGLIMLLCRRSTTGWLARSLAAVGQMAFSNYILHTLICTTIFYGHGFGQFGRVSRVGQAGIVVAIWAVQLVISPLWLRRFRFGPLEWLWRTLTYRRLQPLRRDRSSAE